jgi:hypothetical protein
VEIRNSQSSTNASLIAGIEVANESDDIRRYDNAIAAITTAAVAAAAAGVVGNVAPVAPPTPTTAPPIYDQMNEHAILVTCGVDAVYALYQSGRVWRWLCEGNADFLRRPGLRLPFTSPTPTHHINDDSKDNDAKTNIITKEAFIVKISSGSHHTTALSRDGRVYTWYDILAPTL